MRFSTSAALLGFASSAAAFQDQQVLGGAPAKFDKPAVEADADSWVQKFEAAFGELTHEAKAAWDEVSPFVGPEAIEVLKKKIVGSKAKPHTRRPDSEWDHVVKGADVQSIWVQGEDGESHRKVGGRLENFNLRAKKVDPSKLGVDTVKQYTGYLDDDEQDKHLFYCKPTPHTERVACASGQHS